MQSVKTILSILTKKFTIENLYKNLYNIEFYKIAYQNIYAKPSQMTPASDGSTIDGMSLERFNKIIQKMKDGTYQPTNLRRVNIPKKSGGSRPISIPSVDDKLVQEIIRMILEAIYEKTFSDHSHGFRPGRSCHTALHSIRLIFRGTKWWIDADISKCFDNIDHQILLKILSERIKDQKFLALINKFLKTGYIENWQYHKTYSGTPQGSIISPILTNIYFDRFDKFMEKTIEEFTKGTRRKENPEYKKITGRIYQYKKRISNGTNIEKNKSKLKIDRKLQGKTAKYDFSDPSFQRLYYCRYADDFIIGVIGTREQTIQIKEKIINFLRTELNLAINKDKTKITKGIELVRFLGYDIVAYRSTNKKNINGLIGLLMPNEKRNEFIIENRYGRWFQDKNTGKSRFKAQCRPELMSLEPIEIFYQYNAKIRGMYNYYKFASNISKFAGFIYIAHQSYFKTLAAKYRTTCRKLYKNKNYSQNSRIGIQFNGQFKELFIGPLKVVKYYNNESISDLIPLISKYCSKNSLIKRLEAKKCEWCGDDEGPFEVHHVHKLKDLKGKSNWEKLMISRKRKTLVLCHKCHDKLTAGKL